MPGCPLHPHEALTLPDVVLDPVLDAAFVWLCHRRRNWPADADVSSQSYWMTLETSGETRFVTLFPDKERH